MSCEMPLARRSMGFTAKAVFVSLLLLLTVIPVFSQPALGAGEGRSENDYHNDPLTYLLFSFVMTFATVAFLTSLFTFKFGQKKAKLVAIPMLSSGILIWGTWITFNFILRVDYPDDTLLGIIHWVAAPLLKPLMAIVGVVLGGGLALFIFLTIVVRS